MARRLVKRVALLLAVSTLTLLGVRIYDSQRGPELERMRCGGRSARNSIQTNAFR